MITHHSRPWQEGMGLSDRDCYGARQNVQSQGSETRSVFGYLELSSEYEDKKNEASCQILRQQIKQGIEELTEYTCWMNPVLGRIFTKALGYCVECRIKVQPPDTKALEGMEWGQLSSERDSLKRILKELNGHWGFWQWQLTERHNGDIDSMITWAAVIQANILARRGWPDRIDIVPV